jgi:hypothetical protein
MGTVALLRSTHGLAAPEYHVGLIPAVCGVEGDEGPWGETDFCAAVQLDALFGHRTNRDFGFGPFGRIGSVGFSNVRPELGLSGLVPVLSGFPLVLSAGAYASLGSGAHPGVSGQIFWGSRSYNPYGNYAAGFGLVGRLEAPFTQRDPSVIWLGLELDGMWLALPFVALTSWISGPPDD